MLLKWRFLALRVGSFLAQGVSGVLSEDVRPCMLGRAGHTRGRVDW